LQGLCVQYCLNQNGVVAFLQLYRRGTVGVLRVEGRALQCGRLIVHRQHDVFRTHFRLQFTGYHHIRFGNLAVANGRINGEAHHGIGAEPFHRNNHRGFIAFGIHGFQLQVVYTQLNRHIRTPVIAAELCGDGTGALIVGDGERCHTTEIGGYTVEGEVILVGFERLATQYCDFRWRGIRDAVGIVWIGPCRHFFFVAVSIVVAIGIAVITLTIAIQVRPFRRIGGELVRSVVHTIIIGVGLGRIGAIDHFHVISNAVGIAVGEQRIAAVGIDFVAIGQGVPIAVRQ
tara:strand:- start:84001 stop:84861 length:861 start_codon:yes stop_codon:yes gene_type:complete